MHAYSINLVMNTNIISEKRCSSISFFAANTTCDLDSMLLRFAY